MHFYKTFILNFFNKNTILLEALPAYTTTQFSKREDKHLEAIQSFDQIFSKLIYQAFTRIHIVQ
jgi:hypothetical protein